MFQNILQLMTWKNRIKRSCKRFFSVDFSLIDTNDIMDINKYLMERAWHKIILGLTQKKKIIGLLTSQVNASN